MPRSATDAVIHLKGGLGLRSISELSTETHATSHARTRLKGDKVINHVLDTTLERQGNLCEEKVHASEAEITFREVLNLSTVQVEIPNFTGERASNHQNQIFFGFLAYMF